MISRLLAEHDHIQKTLNLLEIMFFELCRGRKPDYSMMFSIVTYIQEYPEQTHHPLEDVIFSRILEHGGPEAKTAKELITDHTALEAITRRLRKSLDLLKSNTASNENEVKQKLSSFLSRQRNHLYVEEMIIYPAIKKILGKHDWDLIESMFPIKNDPVFGERTSDDYENLYREIEKKKNRK